MTVETPLMFIDKAATWALAEQLGGDALTALIVEHTHTCYLGERGLRHAWGYGCGDCPAAPCGATVSIAGARPPAERTSAAGPMHPLQSPGAPRLLKPLAFVLQSPACRRRLRPCHARPTWFTCARPASTAATPRARVHGAAACAAAAGAVAGGDAGADARTGQPARAGSSGLKSREMCPTPSACSRTCWPCRSRIACRGSRPLRACWRPGPVELRHALIGAARRLMTADGMVTQMDQLRWVALRHLLAGSAVAAPAAAETDLAELDDAHGAQGLHVQRLPVAHGAGTRADAGLDRA